MRLSNEAKVGGLILVTVVIAMIFAWVIGIPNPFSKTVSFYVTYNYAGGIELGSPVRVSGIKVGKVERIEFFVPAAGTDPHAVASPGITLPGEPDYTTDKAIVPLRLKVSVQKDAAVGIRRDSGFFINMAGIIGERYIEVTPGSVASPQVVAGETVAGIDPPRFDQLISQSFDLAGKLKDIIDKNKGDFARTIELLSKLSGNINSALGEFEKGGMKDEMKKLVSNLVTITSDVRRVTDKTHTPEGERTLKLLYDLLWRLEPVDRAAIKKFFQDEGVKARIF